MGNLRYNTVALLEWLLEFSDSVPDFLIIIKHLQPNSFILSQVDVFIFQSRFVCDAGVYQSYRSVARLDYDRTVLSAIMAI